jgi:glucose-1-phosphate cytidylyltransferase
VDPRSPSVDLPVVILCGGRGTRLGAGQTLPKPLVEVGGLPIGQHVVGLYAAQGLRRFLLAAGHRADLLSAAVASIAWPRGVRVTCVDTGVATETGGRVHRLRERLAGEPFHLTYADGVADVDLAALEDEHRAAGRTATITVVRPELQFGVVDIAADGGVTGFREKPRSSHWINGGFMRLEPDVFDVLDDDAVLERDPFARLAREGRLHSHRHEGFWACMDTYKDARRLNELWEAGVAPWDPSTVPVASGRTAR